MRDLEKPVLILIGLCVFLAQVSYAQPTIPKEDIPADIDPEVREQIERLYSEDAEERVHAADTLGGWGEKAAPAVPFLMDLLDDPLELLSKARTPFMAATSALIRLGEPPIEVLTNALKHENTYVQTSAIRFLALTRDLRAVEPVVAALDDQVFAVRHAAASVLGNMVWDGHGVDLLLGALDDKSWRVRSSAALALGWRKVPQAREPLFTALEDGHTQVQHAAELALWWLGEPGLVEHLIDALTDEEAYVRREAALALGQSADERAVKPLITALHDESGGVRETAASALGSLHDPRAVLPLIGALKDEWQQVRRAAASALGAIGDARAVEALIDALGDKDYDVRHAATCALGHFKDKRAVDPLIAVLLRDDGYLRQAAAQALGEIGDTRAVRPLVTALRTARSPAAQTTVTQVLIKMGQPAIGSLIAALGDRDLSVRWHAAFALRRITGEDFGLDRAAWDTWWRRTTVQYDTTSIGLIVIFLSGICIALPVGALVIRLLLRAFGWKLGPRLSPAERLIALSCLVYVIAIMFTALVIANTASDIPLLYRNPLWSMVFRFALAYLVAIPVVVVFRMKKEQVIDGPVPKRHLLKAMLALQTFVVVGASACMAFSCHLLLGYYPSMLVNPWQVLIPLALAILVHLLFSVRLLSKCTIGRRVFYVVALPAAAVVTLCLVTWPVTLCGPHNYYWLGRYLSSKYATEGRYPHRFLDGPDAPAVAEEQLTPFGLAVRYLVFGERAVDHSAIFD